jgi:uncharacterized protein
MMEKAVSFKSGGETCKGVLYSPDSARGKVPAMVMAGGWCYTKEIVMPHYAKFFESLGIALLRFDYRRFGESTGELRQHIDPWEQIEDYKNAISFLETLPEVDAERIGIWGISYSGGHVLVTAATDPRVKWAISTIPVVDGFTTMRRCHGERRFAELQALITSDLRQRGAGKKGGMMPMSSLKPHEELSAWPYPHVCEIFNDIKKREAPRHEHINTIESVENLMMYNVTPYCWRITETPVMMAIAKSDNITSADLEITAFNAIANPNKKLAIVEGVHHMSLYSNTDHLAKVGNVQADWLRETVLR